MEGRTVQHRPPTPVESGQVKDLPHKWGLLIGRCGKASHLLEVVGELQILVEQVAKVRDREGMHPVVVGRIPIAFLHHQAESVGGAKAAEGPQPLLHLEALQTAQYIFFPFFTCDPVSENGSLFTEPSPSPQSSPPPPKNAWGCGLEARGQWEGETGLCSKGSAGDIPGQSRAVDFVVIDEVHILQHAQDGL